ncbi:MAG: prolyl oligopeptidase [Blastocatellia bacterium]|jgi:prolyl oligopeptidase|nr:prolyl oligopeptidase [Blastocatellia bacterium]
MRSIRSLIFVALLSLVIGLANQFGSVASAQLRLIKPPPPPKTRVENIAETLHGVTVADPYRWLEDQDSPATRAWIDEQNRYTQSVVGSLPGREAIHKRLEQLLKIETMGIPTVRGARYFFSKRKVDQNQSVIYMRQGLKGPDEVLIDPNKMSADQTTSVGIVDVTEDGKWLIYSVRQGGKDENTIRILDIDSRKELPDQMAEARYSGFEMLPDKRGVYYSKAIYPAGEKRTVSRLYYHVMGTPQSDDKMIFGEGYGFTDTVSPNVSPDGHYLVISVSHGSSGDNVDLYVKDLKNDGPITTIVKDMKASFGAQIIGDHIYSNTNYQAPNRRIVDIDLRNPAFENWRVVVPEGTNVITGSSIVGGKLFVNYLENVTTRAKVFETSGKWLRDIKFPVLGSSGGMSGRPDRDEGFYSFSSFGQPSTIYRYIPSSGKQEVWAQLNVPVNGAEIETKQVWYPSKDGTKIPMFLVYKKGTVLDGNRPTFLTGYGGFNLRQTPGFSSTAAFWAEHGGVFALPNLRGGGEFGEKWHKAGMFENKQNVFDDFIGAAEWLIQNKYTKPSKLAISGGSNGGLLVGAALTQRPDLFQAVVCSYPLLDMVRYDKFLVAKFWTTEYGSAEEATQFPYIYKYSPYHNVRPGTKYPAVLFITGDSDTRVAPLHARKMTALLQAANASDRPIILHYDTKAGHSGGLPVSKQIDDQTDTMSFLFWQLGMTP